MSVPIGHDVNTCVCPDCIAARRPKSGSLASNYEGLPNAAKPWIAVGVVVAAVLFVWAVGSAMVGNDECDGYQDRIAETMTFLQMGDPSMSVGESLARAEQIEGPRPTGC